MQASTEASKLANKQGGKLANLCIIQQQMCMPATPDECGQHVNGRETMYRCQNLPENYGKNIWMPTPPHQNVLIHPDIWIFTYRSLRI